MHDTTAKQDAYVIEGDSRVELAALPEAAFDSCVTDPPYELGFMGKAWDRTGIAYDVEFWRLVFRVLKPGAHLVAFGGTRTYHRMACAIEDAGFEIRDQMQWLFGSGFPKSLDVSKAIDRLNGERTVPVGTAQMNDMRGGDYAARSGCGTTAVPVYGKEPAAAWDGWGTALKPANEPIVLARKPLEKGLNVAQNVLKWGTGALNIDACRIEFVNQDDQNSAMWGRGTDIRGGNLVGATDGNGKTNIEANGKGRWPANVILSWNEDEYQMRPDLTAEEKSEMFRWLNENA